MCNCDWTMEKSYFMNAVWSLVRDGTIPFDEYKNLLGKYTKRAEKKAKEMKLEDYNDKLKRTSQWKENRQKAVQRAEENLRQAKEWLAQTDKEIEETLAPYRN